MNRDETVAFFLEREARRCKARVAALAEGKSQGEALEAGHEAARVHWNDWAEAHLIEREMPEKTGCTKNPSANAKVDFSRCVFLVKETEGAAEAEGEIETESVPLKTITIDGPFVDMRDFVFPGEASFESTTFAGDVRFGTAIFKGNTYFDGAIFSGDASLTGHLLTGVTFEGLTSFVGTTFKGAAFFSNATFEAAEFDWCTFENIASFDGAVFSQLGSFCSVIFEDVAKFNYVVFKGAAKFYNASVKGDTKFDKAIFEGRAEFDSASFNYVSFLKTTFGGATSFPDATFAQAVSFSDASFINVGESADFSAIRVERAFDLKGAKFLEVPSFSQADFKQAPDLDSVRFPLPSHCPWRFGEPTLIPKYRAIRRMAIQGADYEREQMAFKGEIRSKRGTEHRWYHAAFWYGLAYDALSDFGRSMSRPSLAWLISIGVFGLFYLASSGIQYKQGLRLSTGKSGIRYRGSPFVQAYFFVVSMT